MTDQSLFYVDKKLLFQSDFSSFELDAGILREQNRNLFEYCYCNQWTAKKDVSCINLYGYTIDKNGKINDRDVGMVTVLGTGYTVYSEIPSFELEPKTGEDEVVRRIVRKNAFVAEKGGLWGFEQVHLRRKIKMSPPITAQYFNNHHTPLIEFVAKTNGRFPCTKCKIEFVDTKCFVCRDRLCNNCHVITSTGFCDTCHISLTGEVSCTQCHGSFCIDCHRNKFPKCDPKSTVATIIRTNVLDLNLLNLIPDPKSYFANQNNVQYSYTTAKMPQHLPWVLCPRKEIVTSDGWTVAMY